MGTPTHIAFADESYYTNQRYRSLAVVTFEANYKSSFTQTFSSLIQESGLREFKWNKLRQARDRLAATKIIDEVICLSAKGQLRVDTLIWDTYDTRHKIRGRDDIANLQRIYYHLFKNILQRRWPTESTWQLFPDENSALDWISVQDYLDLAGLSLKTTDLFGQNTFGPRLSQDFKILEIHAVSSTAEAICRIADLFAGVGAFSHSEHIKYKNWLQKKNGQLSMKFDSDINCELSNSQEERFEIIRYLDESCKQHKYHVGLNSINGFKSYDPNYPVNFWVYVPQSLQDNLTLE